MTSRRARPFVFAAGALAILALLSACAYDPGDYETPRDTRMARLTALVGLLPSVVAVQALKTLEGSAGVGSAVVIVAVEAPTEDVLAVAEATHTAAADIRWEGEVAVRRATTSPYDSDLEHAENALWQVEVFPGDAASWRPHLVELLAVDTATASSTEAVGDWPFATIETIGEFSAEFHRLSATAQFSRGGTYQLAYTDHLRIVHVPARTSDEAIDEFISIAAEYPDAEVLLEAPTIGPQWPALFIARLTAEQAAELDTRLRDSALADADPEGYPMQFVLSVITADGPVYTVGTLGDVPSV